MAYFETYFKRYFTFLALDLALMLGLFFMGLRVVAAFMLFGTMVDIMLMVYEIYSNRETE